MSWIFSLMHLVFKDVEQLIQYLAVILMIITPIAYTSDMVPRQLVMITVVNPLYYFVCAYQDLIVYERLPQPGVCGVLSALGLGTFCLGYRVFVRAKKVFYDYA
jgi:lipopolysaccharide transport system permease protein